MYLLDTNYLLWWLGNKSKISKEIESIITSHAGQVYVSVASLWEIEIKRSIGKLQTDEDIVKAVHDNGFRTLNIIPAHTNKITALPLCHQDPFDRMLVAQALEENMTLISADKKIYQYDVDVIG